VFRGAIVPTCLAGLCLVACSDASSQGRPDSASASTSAASSSASLPTVEHHSESTAIVAPEAPLSHLCVLGHVLTPADSIVLATVEAAEQVEQVKDARWEATFQLRKVEILVHESVLDERSTFTKGARSSLVDVRSFLSDHGSAPVDYLTVDSVELLKQPNLLLLIEHMELDSGTTPRLLAALDKEDGFLGPCGDEFDKQLTTVAKALNTPPESLLSSWTSAPIDPVTGYTRFDEILTVASDAELQSGVEAAWYSTDARLRSLRPTDVPAAIRKSLDVRGVSLTMRLGTAENVVIVRTQSGTSIAVSGDLSDALVAAYFTPEDKTIEILVGKSADDLEPQLLATIDLVELGDSYMVSAAVDLADLNATVKELSDLEAASLLGLRDQADLEEMRRSFLEVGEAADS